VACVYCYYYSVLCYRYTYNTNLGKTVHLDNHGWTQLPSTLFSLLRSASIPFLSLRPPSRRFNRPGQPFLAGAHRLSTLSNLLRPSHDQDGLLFAWLAFHGRLWTAERRFRFGLQTTRSPCFTCLQEEDTLKHIMAGCVYTRQVWVGCLLKLQVMVDAPQMDDSLQSWWLRTRNRFRSKERRGFDSLVVLVSWRLWRQRNARCFNNIQK
jgi:hypothetical protein